MLGLGPAPTCADNPPEFGIGSVVRMRSGGPKMTVVTEIDDEGQVKTQWINLELKLEWMHFPIAALRHVPPEEP